jgi:hypothetical protein
MAALIDPFRTNPEAKEAAGALRANGASISEIAEMLRERFDIHIQERTLRRRLDEEGAAYSKKSVAATLYNGSRDERIEDLRAEVLSPEEILGTPAMLFRQCGVMADELHKNRKNESPILISVYRRLQLEWYKLAAKKISGGDEDQDEQAREKLRAKVKAISDAADDRKADGGDDEPGDATQDAADPSTGGSSDDSGG